MDKFTMFDLLIVTMMAVLGVAIKPVVVPLAHIITGPLYVPGGLWPAVSTCFGSFWAAAW